jgi:hypothetical protein
MAGDRKRLVAWAGAALVTPLILNDSQIWWLYVCTFLLIGIVLHAPLNVSLVWFEQGIGTVSIAAAAGISLFAPMPDVLLQPSWVVRGEAFVVCLVATLFFLVAWETIRDWWQNLRHLR